MSDSTNTKEVTKPESSSQKPLQAIIAGAIGSFLFPFFFIAIPYWVGNSSVSPLEALFLDLPILDVFIGKASIIGFVVMRALLGGVFGYWAWLILRRKKTFVVILGAFLAGLIGGAILLFCGMVLSLT